MTNDFHEEEKMHDSAPASPYNGSANNSRGNSFFQSSFGRPAPTVGGVEDVLLQLLPSPTHQQQKEPVQSKVGVKECLDELRKEIQRWNYSNEQKNTNDKLQAAMKRLNETIKIENHKNMLHISELNHRMMVMTDQINSMSQNLAARNENNERRTALIFRKLQEISLKVDAKQGQEDQENSLPANNKRRMANSPYTAFKRSKLD